MLSDNAALGIIGRIGVSSAKDPGPANRCKLTECQGKLRCATCLAMDARYPAPPKLNPRCAWPFPGRAPAEDSEGGTP